MGAEFTLHRVRSLLGSLYAEAHPGDERTAQLKLGHKDVAPPEGSISLHSRSPRSGGWIELIDSLVAGHAGKVDPAGKGGVS